MPNYKIYVRIEGASNYDITADSEEDAINAAIEQARENADARDAYVVESDEDESEDED